jgi:predicted secreted protein
MPTAPEPPTYAELVELLKAKPDWHVLEIKDPRDMYLRWSRRVDERLQAIRG